MFNFSLKRALSQRKPVPWLCAALVCVLAILARTYLIQPPAIAHGCEQDMTWWCAIRLGIIYTYAFHTVGQLAVVLAIASLLWRRVWLAAAALAAGFAALVLYCYEPGAFAITLSAVVLARLQTPGMSGVPPGQQGYQA